MPCWRRLAASFSSRFDSCKSPNAHVAEIANVVGNPQIAIWNKLHIVHAYFVRFSKPCPCFQSLEISVTMGASSFVEMPGVALHVDAYSCPASRCQSKLRFWRGSSIWRWTPHCQSQFEACLTCLCFPRMCFWKLATNNASSSHSMQSQQQHRGSEGHVTFQPSVSFPNRRDMTWWSITCHTATSPARDHFS